MTQADVIAPETPAVKAYDAASVQVLEGLQAVHKRPGMYIGDTDDGSGLHHMAFEIIDNAIDEALAGYCDLIEVTISPGNSVTVSDNGRGIPVDMHAKGRPAIEIILTSLHSGGKFDQSSYKVSGGLHGVGAAVVNALSSRMEVEVRRNGNRYAIAFNEGAVVEELRVTGTYEGRTGTTVTFTPSRRFFPRIELSAGQLSTRIQTLAFLNPGVRLRFLDARLPGSEPEDFNYAGGIVEMLRHMDRTMKAYAEPIKAKGERRPDVRRTITGADGKDVEIVEQGPLIEVDVAFEWCESGSDGQISAFTNNIPQRDGGAHVTGFKSAVTKSLGAYADANPDKNFKDVKPDGEDFMCGMTAVVSVKMPDPQFSSQTKDKLTSSAAMGAVNTITSEALRTWLDENPAKAKDLLKRARENASARERARKILVKRKSAMDSFSVLPGKLADCSDKDPTRCELFIVEGDSAGGSAKGGRDRKTQAILPIKGKILNVERAKLDKILNSEEIGTLVDALGVRGVRKNAEYDKLRYHKIIIMTDADIDGSHIATLLMTFFLRELPGIIEGGHLYMAQAPLFAAERTRGKEAPEWLIDQAALDEWLLKLGCEKATAVANDGEVYEGAALLELGRRTRDTAKLIASLTNEIGLQELTECLTVSGAFHPDVHQDDAYMSECIGYVCSLMGGPFGSAARMPGTTWSGSVTPAGMAFSYTRKGVTKHIAVSRAIAAHPAARELFRRFDELERLYVPGIRFSNGRKEVLAFSPRELFDAIAANGSDGIVFKRFKGLGEMNPEQLWATTLNPVNRKLLKIVSVSPNGSAEITSVCMSDDVEQRREMITKNAMRVEFDLHGG